VFTTVHANNVVDVLGRFINMGVEPYQFVSALNCVLAQRLVRTICSECKRPEVISDEVLAESGIERLSVNDFEFFEGAGCIDCAGTGYRGRTAIYELLNLTDSIREMILQRRSTADIKREAASGGMRFLREVAIEQVMAGRTTLREINKVTFAD
jgi:type IV pilus assembly protein PilB